MKRREFLKLTAASGLLLATDAGVSRASEAKGPSPDAVGILFDATLCIGCKVCMVACKRENSVPGGALWTEGMTRPPFEYNPGLRNWDMATDLTSRTLNIILTYRNGTGNTKNAEIDGYTFVKRHCMHCAEPACVSACPVSAMTKDKKTGIVTYDKDACIGCRYCQVACPFNIPKFEWDQAYPQIRKCQLCNHRLKEGKYAACCEFCPVGASIYGKVTDLRAEAERRLAQTPGDFYDYPQQRVDSFKTVSSKVARYQKHIYGVNEVGGTQYLMLSGVSPDKLGLPKLPERSFTAKSETIQHTLYKGMIAPGVLLAGLLFAAYRSGRGHEGEDKP